MIERHNFAVTRTNEAGTALPTRRFFSTRPMLLREGNTTQKNNAAINALLSMDKSATLKADRQGKITVRNYSAV